MRVGEREAGKKVYNDAKVYWYKLEQSLNGPNIKYRWNYVSK